MIIPVRCFSCGAPVGAWYEEVQDMVKKGKTMKEAMDSVGISRYCCRRMILGQVDLLPLVSKFKKG